VHATAVTASQSMPAAVVTTVARTPFRVHSSFGTCFLNLRWFTVHIVWSGVATFFSGTVGFLIGSYITKRLTLSSKNRLSLTLSTTQLLKAMFFLSVVATATIPMFTIQCEMPPLADVTTQQHAGPTARNSALVLFMYELIHVYRGSWTLYIFENIIE